MGRLIRAVRLLARITRQVSVMHLIFFVYIQSAAVNWVHLWYWLQNFNENFLGLQQHWIDSLVNAPTLEKQKELW